MKLHASSLSKGVSTVHVDAAAPLAASQISILKQARKRAKLAPEPKLGVEQIRAIQALDPDYGLSWRYSCLHDMMHVPPSGRREMVMWALGGSPVMAKTFELAYEAIKRREKIVVVMENPACQM